MKIHKLLSVLMLLILPVHSLASHANAKPNIIFFITDDQSPFSWHYQGNVSAIAFGFNGEKRAYSPEIDRLARDGMIFTAAYVSSSVCTPSRYTTLTGRYAGRCEGTVFKRLHPEGTITRVENNTELEDDKWNLAKVLQANGYRTGFVGKSHIVDQDVIRDHKQWEEKHGLKEYDMNDDPRDPKITARMKHNHKEWCKRIARHGFDYVNGVYCANLKGLYNKAANVHNVEWTTKAALDFIKSSNDKPFFLYYATTTPHGPAPWNTTNGKYSFGLDADPRMTGEGWVDKDYSFMPTRKQIMAEAVANGASKHDAWLLWIDSAIGALRKQLEKQGLFDNTLIIITSDHGAWRHGKTTLHEGGLRVPLAMHWPDTIQAGSRYDELVQNIDFTPTILDIAGIEPPKDMHLDGLSLKNVLQGSKHPLRDHLFAELGYSRGVFTKEWKYIAIRYDENTKQQISQNKAFRGFQGEALKAPYLTRNGHLGHYAAKHNPHYFEADQLYNIKEDPKEEKNLAATHQEQVSVMQAILQNKLKTFDHRPFGEFTP